MKVMVSKERYSRSAWWIGSLTLALTAACAAVPATAPALNGAPSQPIDPLEAVKLYGDLRLRQEFDWNRDGQEDRERLRLRLRLGANYQLEERVLVGARLATGDPDDANSTHVTLGDGFQDLDLSLDRAFVTFRPGERLSLTGGKFNHPLVLNPVYGELVWDGDVQPEGAMGVYTFSDPAPLRDLRWSMGAYSVVEQGNADDAFAIVGQLAAGVDWSEDLSSTLALGYYHYTDPTPDGTVGIFGADAGNATIDTDGDGTADDFASDYGVLNPIATLDYGGWDVPFVLSAEYMLNTRAELDRDEGWALGFAAGSTAKRGDWRAYYQWQVVEQDSVFSPVSQDDFLLRTNFRGHVFGVSRQLSDQIGLNLWAFVTARDHTTPGPTTDEDEDQWRVRIDLNIKF